MVSIDLFYGDISEFFNEFDVCLCLCGKGVKGFDWGDGCLLVFKFFVDNFESVKVVEVGGEVFDDFVSFFVFVGDSNFDGRECV